MIHVVIIETGDGTVLVDGPYPEAQVAFAAEQIAGRIARERDDTVYRQPGCDTPTWSVGIEPDDDDAAWVYVAATQPSVEVES